MQESLDELKAMSDAGVVVDCYHADWEGEYFQLTCDDPAAVERFDFEEEEFEYDDDAEDEAETFEFDDDEDDSDDEPEDEENRVVWIRIS
jgi:hypothetical protein